MREFEALKKQWQRGREDKWILYAGIQATLHNAHFRSREQHPEAFTPEQFMPGAKPRPPQSTEDKKMILGSMFTAIRDNFRKRKAG